MVPVLDRWRRQFRPTRVQIAALVLLTVFSLGPLAASWLVLRSTADPNETVQAPASLGPDGVTVTGTVLGVNAVTGELVVRLVPRPGADLVEEGRLTDPLVLQVNDVRGRTTWDYPAGTVPGPVETALALADGNIAQYPFDTYRADLVVFVTSGAGDDLTAVPVTAELTSIVTDFTITAPTLTTSRDVPSPLGLARLEVGRRGTTVIYAVSMMVLMWGLAITGVLLAWAVVISGVEVPLWAYGYFVGILFALPPLRDSLPGRPPPGVLLDFVAFYWSVGIVGVTLLLLVGVWILRVRRHGGGGAEPEEAAAEPST